MTESLITISIIGLVAGFIFSMPIAGPISILVTSNALKGRIKYCNLLAVGSSVADFLYVIFGVYGITHLFAEYKPVIPYILGAGSVFILFVGIKIIRTKFDTEHINEESIISETHIKAQRGALYTGFMINILNPTLFFGWIVSSFIVLSFAASLGFDTGGLNSMIDQDLSQIEKIDGNLIEKPQLPSYLQFDTLNIMKKQNAAIPNKPVIQPRNFKILVSVFYSVFLSVGSILWFFLLTLLLVRFRKRININVLNWLIRGMGIILCLFAVFFGYSAVKMLLS
ncbi:MAG: LysE family transporter [Bacteroidia bacterium]|nr:LysE family transporter [Bacteroidia bacterium]